jgi:hypothetical protein
LKIKDVLRPEIILEGNKELMEKNSIPKAKVAETGGSGFGNQNVWILQVRWSPSRVWDFICLGKI